MKVVLDTNVFASSVFGGLPREVVELWFDGRVTLCLSEPIVEEYQRVLREMEAAGETEERALIEAFATGEGVLYVNDPPAIESASSDLDDDKFLECALELGAECVVSGGSDLSELRSYMRIPVLAPRAWSGSVKRPANSSRAGRRPGESRRGYIPRVGPFQIADLRFRKCRLSEPIRTSDKSRCNQEFHWKVRAESSSHFGIESF